MFVIAESHGFAELYATTSLLQQFFSYFVYFYIGNLPTGYKTELAIGSLQFIPTRTADGSSSHRNVNDMSWTTFALVVIFVVSRIDKTVKDSKQVHFAKL